jgi:hypothetical protein
MGVLGWRERLAGRHCGPRQLLQLRPITRGVVDARQPPAPDQFLRPRLPSFILSSARCSPQTRQAQPSATLPPAAKSTALVTVIVSVSISRVGSIAVGVDAFSDGCQNCQEGELSPPGGLTDQ